MAAANSVKSATAAVAMDWPRRIGTGSGRLPEPFAQGGTTMEAGGVKIVRRQVGRRPMVNIEPKLIADAVYQSSYARADRIISRDGGKDILIRLKSGGSIQFLYPGAAGYGESPGGG